MFRTWSDGLPASIEVRAVELPGRGKRRHEPPLSSLPRLIEILSRALRPLLDRPFAFFGHSFGALVAFELARALRREGRVGPASIFVSARRAPHLPDIVRPLHALPEPELLRELRRLNGTPREVLECRELMDLVLPCLRCDFSMDETYAYAEEPPLSCPIWAFGGQSDPRAGGAAALEAWRWQTSISFRSELFPGDHFYLQQAEPALLRRIIDTLKETAPLM